MNPNNQFLTKEFLFENYVNKGLSTYDIARLLSVSDSNVRDQLVRFNIPRRGTGPLGKSRTKESIVKQIETRKNNGRPWHSEISKKKIGEANKGPQTEEHIKHKVESRKKDGKPWFRTFPKGQDSKIQLRNYYKNRYASDLNFRMGRILSTALKEALKKQGVSQSKRAIELLGCSIEEFKLHIEKQWQPGMNWKNHKRDGWHLDHIKPKASFDLSKPEEQQKCFHYTNFQPMWATPNRRKSSWYQGVRYLKKII